MFGWMSSVFSEVSQQTSVTIPKYPSEDPDYIYSLGNGEQVETVRATKTNQTRWGHTGEGEVNPHMNGTGFQNKTGSRKKIK